MFAVALAFDESYFTVMDEPVDEGDDAGGAWKNGVPVAEGEVGGEDKALVFITPADDLEEQIGVAIVVGEVADLINAKEFNGRRIVEQPVLGQAHGGCRRGFDFLVDFAQ